jgi:Icc-related predicted phosphoesterase
MKIACISDTHMQHRSISILPCDILIHSGDIFSTGKELEVRDFFDWLSIQPSKYKLLVSGNHDRMLQKKIEKFNISLDEITFVLDNIGSQIENIHFWGIPYRPLTYLLYEQGIEDRSELLDYSKIPANTDILITHVAPEGILDNIVPGDKGYGSPGLLAKVHEIKPKYHIFGHTHESYGIFKNERTNFINASLTEHEKVLHEPIYFEL